MSATKAAQLDGGAALAIAARRASLLVLARRCIELVEETVKPVAVVFGLGVETGALEDPPVTQQRPEDVVVVDAQVVDPRVGHPRGFAREAGDVAPRHLEREDLACDR